MKSFLIACLLILSSISALADVITEKDVNALLAKADMAINKHDTEALQALFSEKASVVVTIYANGKTSEVNAGRAEYSRYLRQIWASSKNYFYKRSNEKTVIEAEKATVTSDVKETMTTDNRLVRIRSKSTMVLVKENDKLLIVSLKMTGEM